MTQWHKISEQRPPRGKSVLIHRENAAERDCIGTHMYSANGCVECWIIPVNMGGATDVQPTDKWCELPEREEKVEKKQSEMKTYLTLRDMGQTIVIRWKPVSREHWRRHKERILFSCNGEQITIGDSEVIAIRHALTEWMHDIETIEKEESKGEEESMKENELKGPAIEAVITLQLQRDTLLAQAEAVLESGFPQWLNPQSVEAFNALKATVEKIRGSQA